MTTPTHPFFKEEPGLNAPKIGKRQVVRNVDIAFDEIRKRPKTLAGYGIIDAVRKAWVDEKFGELLGYIQALQNTTQSLQQRVQECERKNAEQEMKIASMEARI